MFEVLDIMNFLKEEYLNALKTAKEEQDALPSEEQRPIAEPSLDHFIEWARNYLAEENQPMNVAYLAKGLGLRMQHGQTISFIPQEDEEQGMYDEGIHVTRPRTNPGYGMIPTHAEPITGRRR